MNSPEKEKREQETYESFFAGSDQQKSPLRPQPKQEWSKEDEMYLSQAIEVLEHENYLILADNLKSLRPSWKPSEEQMEALNYAIAEWDGGKRLEGLYALRNDLKKLM